MINNINYLKMSKVIGLLLIMLLFSDYTFEQSCEEATEEDLEFLLCSDFPTSDSNTHDCVSNGGSKTQPCREELKQCNDITALGDFSCSDFPTSDYMYACVRNEDSSNQPTPCRELLFCEYVTDQLGQNQQCEKYPVNYNEREYYECRVSGGGICVEAKKKM